ncbi:hypothetical protein NEMBOFW57_001049 [Staphylotrichum longicolle]|uniref:Uncharacterized protein n=1 Tax=Staphylotrichum longicolle TaxID=669026 RepID=A0AAD4F122_9PEZI|nr:hypothetical protein NEMBOFW57_001049 [Staphylotrichum longicolle]
MQLKFAALKTSESNAPWLVTPTLKEAETEASKLEEFKLVTSRSQRDQRIQRNLKQRQQDKDIRVQNITSKTF